MKRIRTIAISGLIFFLASNGALAERQAQYNTPLANSIAELSAIEAALLNTPIAETEIDRAEASLYLAKNLVHYLRTDVIQGNPHQPLLLSMPGYGFPNPDNLYLGTQLDPQGVYRVWGRLGNVNRTIFGVYSSKALEGVSGGGARLLGSELKTDAQGHFELFVSLKRMGENWLPMTKDTQSMTIYQIYSDWENERKGKLMIERLDGIESPPPHLTTLSFNARVAGLGKKMSGFLEIWTGITQRYHGGIPDNTILAPRRIQVTYRGGQMSPGHWRLKEDEALIIEFDDPKTSYWGFSFYQPWGELLDIASRQASLNSSQALRDSDGKYRLVLSAKDPGVANWIDVGGHSHGVFNWRVTSDNPLEKASTSVVPFADLQQHLPPDTKYVSPTARAEALRKRRQHMARRLSP